ncbi:LAMI_0G01948g1_1 [Lachancea mirantina]|uniref:LAMI_0G01948g1_1 n=1 Tax=Lachancea mirantina TaxID=1230905 RepID=A0A1G4K7M0_9SACH|nr:LAMI_0G01948g1_1 [Lachancea mirantina]
MSSVTIEYQFKTYKCKVDGGSNLKEVLVKSVANFKLGSDSIWSLIHNGKELPLELPWRLLNLPNGVKLALQVRSEKAVSQFRVKFQIVGVGSRVVTVKGSQTILEALNCVVDDIEMEIDVQTAKLQIFSTIVESKDFGTTTFSMLGIIGDVSARLMFTGTPVRSESAASAASVALAALPDSKTIKHEQESPKQQPIAQDKPVDPVNKSVPELSRKPHALIPPAEFSGLHLAQPEDTDYEMSLEQARKYQDMLSRNARPTNGFLTKRLREKQQQDVAKPVEVCNVRVRLPDRTHIEASFSANDTIADVYMIIKNSLRDPDIDFRLFHSHPHKLIRKDNARLVDDLQFSSKTLLVFESLASGPYLKKELLDSASDLTNLEPTADSQDLKSDEQKPTKQSKPLTSGKTPKWLKLGKK